MRERESEGNHREDCKKNPNYHLLILQLHIKDMQDGVSTRGLIAASLLRQLDQIKGRLLQQRYLSMHYNEA